MCKCLYSDSWEAKLISLCSPFLPDALSIDSSATSFLKYTKRIRYWSVWICGYKCVQLFLTLISHSSFINLADSARHPCITTSNGMETCSSGPNGRISDVNMWWKFRHLNAQRQTVPLSVGYLVRADGVWQLLQAAELLLSGSLALFQCPAE